MYSALRLLPQQQKQCTHTHTKNKKKTRTETNKTSKYESLMIHIFSIILYNNSTQSQRNFVGSFIQTTWTCVMTTLFSKPSSSSQITHEWHWLSVHDGRVRPPSRVQCPRKDKVLFNGHFLSTSKSHQGKAELGHFELRKAANHHVTHPQTAHHFCLTPLGDSLR